jgi:hypothetical protein
MRDLQRSLIWRRFDAPSLEHCRLWRLDDGWSLEGTVVAVQDERATTVRYEIVLDSSWVTRGVIVRQSLDSDTATIQLRADGERRWWDGSTELEEMRGHLDVDLGITPATNTLPIRRLRLEPGDNADVVAVWIRFPHLEVRTLRQSYTRAAGERYHYRSEGGFEAELTVDEFGIVTRYAEIWEMITDT